MLPTPNIKLFIPLLFPKPTR
jgi:hypothetical protein